jgi:hypothetical protein
MAHGPLYHIPASYLRDATLVSAGSTDGAGAAGLVGRGLVEVHLAVGINGVDVHPRSEPLGPGPEDCTRQDRLRHESAR